MRGALWHIAGGLAVLLVHSPGQPVWAQLVHRTQPPFLQPSPDERPVRLPPTGDAPRYPGLLVSAEQPALPSAAETIAPGDPQGMTLEELTLIASSNHPAIRESDALAAAARGRAVQAGLYPNPVVGTAAPQLAGDQSQYNAYVIQDIVTKGKLGLDTCAAVQAARAAELAAVRTRFEILTDLRRRYAAALAAQQRARILTAMVAVARRAVEISERLFRAELGSRPDVLLLSIELDKAQASLEGAQALVAAQYRQLAAATGLYDLEIKSLTGRLDERFVDYELASLQQSVIQRNAQVAAAQFEFARWQFLLRRAEVEPFPNINMMGGYQYQLPGAQAPQNQAIYQVQMVVPLFNRNQGNIRAAQAELSSAAARLGRVRAALASETASALGRFQSAVEIARRYEQDVLPKAIEVQQITARLYQEGEVEFLRYLAAQRDLLEANLAYIDAQEARWTAAAQVAGLLQSEQFP